MQVSYSLTGYLYYRRGRVKGGNVPPAVAETMRRLARNPRRVLDFLNMTNNDAPRPAPD